MPRPIDFVIAFWGKKFREHFLEHCLASLLAPNNLAAFSEPGLPPVDARLIICTTADDFDAVAQTALFRRWQSLARVEFIDIGLPRPMPSERAGIRHSAAFTHMSLAHKLALQKTVEAKAYCSILTPDMVFADGSLRTLARHIRMGARTVLAPALRFDLATAIKQLDRAGILQPDQPLTIVPRALARIAATSLHSELKRFEYDADHFADVPISTFFAMPGIGVVIHTTSWAIAAADLSDLPDFNDDTLDHQTIDGDFIHRNLVSSEPVLLDDSDEYMILPLTAEEDHPHAQYLVPDPYLAGQPEAIKHERKVTFIRTFLFSDASDPFKRWAAQRPVYIHHGDLPKPPDPVTTRAGAIIAQALAVTPLERPIYFFVAVRGGPQRLAFVKYLLASLMAPNNAPVLAGRPGNRLFIVLDETERAALSQQWRTLQRITAFLKLEFVDIGDPEGQDARLGELRRAVAALSIRDKAYFSVLEPDLLLSDGTIRRAVDLARDGAAAVLATAYPVDGAALEARLVADRSLLLPSGSTNPPARAIHLSARSVAAHALAVRDLGRPDPDGAAGGQGGGELRIEHEAPGGVVVQATAWTVLLIDLGAVAEFRSGHLPGDFLAHGLATLHGRARVHVVTDSDEIAVVRMADAAPRPRDPAASGAAQLAAALADPALPAIARTLLQVPVRWHGADLSPAWDGIEAQARALVTDRDQHPTA